MKTAVIPLAMLSWVVGARADEVVDLLALHPRLDNAYGVVLHPRCRETRRIFVSYAMPEGQPD